MSGASGSSGRADSARGTVNLNVSLESKKFIRTVFAVLVGLEVAFLLMDTVFNYGKLIPIGSIERLFNIAREDSLPAWIASVQTLFVGVVLWMIYATNRKRAWALIACFFTYLAIDDGSKFHERIGTAVKQSGRDVAADASSTLEHSYTWQYVFGPFFVAMGLFILWFMWRELKTRNLRFLIFSALACYGIAVGLDFIEGLPEAYNNIGAAVGLSGKFVNHYGRVLEEFLELFGSTLFLVTFLTHFVRISPKTLIVFDDGSPRT